MTRSAVVSLDSLAEPRVRLRTVVLAAHPDDETLGAGALLTRLDAPTVVHLTDGAPYDTARLHDAEAEARRAAYARCRQIELWEALRLAGVPRTCAVPLGLVDQQAMHGLASASRRLARLLEAVDAELLVTHAYEGGHPDHDGAAFVGRAAAVLCRRAGGPDPLVVEMPLYHDEDGRTVRARFLPPEGEDTCVLPLGGEAVVRKRRQLAAFASQRHVIAEFPVDVERFRAAAPVDFRRPPHEGRLHYEREGWASAAELRACTAEAARDLGLEEGSWR
jgi:LmbE family N-acetylglucosaminyl deacetylase